MTSDMRSSVDKLKRELIVNAAEELFFKQGFMQTSMTEIAQHLSVGKPTIYQFFKSKNEILSEVCNRTTAFAADTAKHALSLDGTASDKIGRIVHELCLRVIDNSNSLAVMFREVKYLSINERQRLSENYHSFNESVSAILSEGVDSGEFKEADFTVVVHAISGAATWIYTWYQPNGRLSPHEVADEMRELILRMLR